MTEHQAQILFGDFAGADRRLQAGQPGPGTGKHQHAAGIAVEPVHQFQVFLRPGRTQQLDRAMTDPAAAVAGHAGGFIDDQEVLVLENHRVGHGCHQAAGRRTTFGPFRHAYRGNPQRITISETGIRLGPLAVHAYLSGTQKPVNHALGHALEQGHQRIVDALTVTLGADLDLTYTVRCVMGSCRLH